MPTCHMPRLGVLLWNRRILFFQHVALASPLAILLSKNVGPTQHLLAFLLFLNGRLCSTSTCQPFFTGTIMCLEECVFVETRNWLTNLVVSQRIVARTPFQAGFTHTAGFRGTSVGEHARWPSDHIRVSRRWEVF